MKTLSKSFVSRQERPVKILQFGNGNFLRGFTDYMVEEANEKGVFNGNIQVVQVHSPVADPKMIEQDCLFHVLIRGLKEGKQVDEAKLITCIHGISNPNEDFNTYLKLAENPDLRFIISNTTESGIQFDSTDINPDELPSSFPGKVAALLYRRFLHFQGDPSKGLIFIPCELIEDNGITLRTCIDQYASLWKLPKAFTEWLFSACTFCNTLVDRIVPGFPKDSIQEIQERIGFEDKLAVMAEPFHFWAIEGPEHVKEEFPLDRAGLDVLFVKDLTPFRTRKVRILNGGHTSMVPYAYLTGIRTVREAVEDPVIGKFMREVIFNEIIPTLDMPKDELEKFANDVLERFANPFIVHELKSIALNSISKFKVRVLPSLLEYYESKNLWPEKLTLAFAALLVFYKGEYKGVETPVNDNPSIMAEFKAAWELGSTKETVEKLLSERSYWGEDLREHEGLVEAVSKAVDELLQA
ncbi:tagaturonate reductase [Algoriphagus machipongonensis]|uniref:Altronate oxidoreductase n=1 Tax=Algoriphagus machipongonensis TaxID=388413 RepID=A3HWR4_9BACT|nr:tagaturonate reductase [Algoriphagus machipongonensis]EAZ81037.1 altronate oxidoreductase [Algoriphagus machipongonensis]